MGSAEGGWKAEKPPACSAAAAVLGGTCMHRCDKQLPMRSVTLVPLAPRTLFSATMASAVRNWSNEMRRPPRDLALLKMMSTSAAVSCAREGGSGEQRTLCVLGPPRQAGGQALHACLRKQAPAIWWEIEGGRRKSRRKRRLGVFCDVVEEKEVRYGKVNMKR